MDKEAVRKRLTALAGRLARNKYVLLVMAVGLLLLLLPQAGTTEEETETGETGEEFSLDALEEKLEETLSRIEGAGRVSVVLTVESGTERVYAADLSQSDQDREKTLVVVSRGSGTEEAVVETERCPTFRGALVVCEGGGDPKVRLQITQAVAVLTGLGTDRISVCEGN